MPQTAQTLDAEAGRNAPQGLSRLPRAMTRTTRHGANRHGLVQRCPYCPNAAYRFIWSSYCCGQGPQHCRQADRPLSIGPA